MNVHKIKKKKKNQFKLKKKNNSQSICLRDKFFKDFDKVFDSLEIIFIQFFTLCRKNVRKINHVNLCPVMFLFIVVIIATQLWQKIRIILFHFDYVSVKIIRVRMCSAQFWHMQIYYTFCWTFRLTKIIIKKKKNTFIIFFFFFSTQIKISKFKKNLCK